MAVATAAFQFVNDERRAVIKLGPGQRYEIDYDYCKGRGMCAAECPSGAITMEPEET